MVNAPRIVYLGDDPDPDVDDVHGVLIVVGSADDMGEPHAESWLQRSTFALSEDQIDDRRVVTVPSVSDSVAELVKRCARWPLASGVCDDVLRSVDPGGAAFAGVIAESLAYSALQAGPEFSRWLAERGPARVSSDEDPVDCIREGDRLLIRFNRPERHNAFSTGARGELLDALTVARLDPAIVEVVLSGRGPSFCSGGDLAEFGSFEDPVSAHHARTRFSPALAVDALTRRLGTRCRAVVHGQVLGSGVEMAAFFGWVDARADSVFGLPELSLGLLPGAGGTVSVTRRIGRWRTAYLVLSGCTVDAETALGWGLVDAILP